MSLSAGRQRAGGWFSGDANGCALQGPEDRQRRASGCGDIATIHFTGWLEQAGKQGREFFNIRAHGTPVSFVVGTDRVIAGWNEGVVGMQSGGKRLLKLPPALAYGSRGVDDMVPPDTPLIFIIELVALEKRP